jgi:hypothetical protein
MNRISFVSLLVACSLMAAPAALAKKAETTGAEAAAAAAPPSAYPEMRYSNGEYGFEFLYYGDWYASEQKNMSYQQRTLRIPSMSSMPEVPGAPSAPRMPKMPPVSSMTMPRTLNVCFATKRNCESKNPDRDPMARLSVMNLQALEDAIPPSMRKQLSKMPAQQEPRAPEAEAEGPECDTIEKATKPWGKTKAQWMAMRCPDGEWWRYSIMVSMQRKAYRGNDQYSLMCTMRSRSKDKEASLAEFREVLKPRCEKIVSTTEFFR